MSNTDRLADEELRARIESHQTPIVCRCYQCLAWQEIIDARATIAAQEARLCPDADGRDNIDRADEFAAEVETERAVWATDREWLTSHMRSAVGAAHNAEARSRAQEAELEQLRRVADWVADNASDIEWEWGRRINKQAVREAQEIVAIALANAQSRKQEKTYDA